MDFEATVHLVLELATGQGARGEWKKQEVVFEIPGEYPRKVCVAFWNQRADEAAALRIGERVAVSTNVESREYNGRWFTELRGWRMSRIQVEPIVGGYSGGQPQAGAGYAGGSQAGAGYAGGGAQPQTGGYQQPADQSQQGGGNTDNPADDLPF